MPLTDMPMTDISLNEASPDTVAGSFSDDLIASKLWLLRRLQPMANDGRIVIIGSWNGNLAKIAQDTEILPVDRMVNIDLDPAAVNRGKKFSQARHICGDANTFDYWPDDTVINTSHNDWTGSGWYDALPPGVVFAVQTRDHNDLMESYGDAVSLYQGNLQLRDQDGAYTRFMLIGVKPDTAICENISTQRPPNSPPSPVGLYYKGYPCTKDCSGHMAGYAWAQRKNLKNASYVPRDIASTSFYEGALSYAQGR
jgi:hypothetical protein